MTARSSTPTEKPSFHGMTRVYQELLSVRRDANEMYLVPVPAQLVGMDFVAAATVFLPDRTARKHQPAHYPSALT
jgi:hypothetical protein